MQILLDVEKIEKVHSEHVNVTIRVGTKKGSELVQQIKTSISENLSYDKNHFQRKIDFGNLT